ncbi:MAG: LpxD N-terminal domain-containing protein [Candidatus Nitrosocosmicus sp.]
MEINVKKELWDLEIDFEYKGRDIFITKYTSITEATKSDATFCYYEDTKAIESISMSNAGVILCKKDLIDKIDPKDGQQLLFVDNPRLAFVRLLKKGIKQNKKEISPHSIISNLNNIGKNCLIASYAFIDENSTIGNNCTIGTRVVIKNSVIGDNCNIQSGTTIGEDGFAYERYPSGNLEHFPHTGRVIISNNVDVFANCSIARGSLQNTSIGEGTKIDSLVHIAHNVKIGSNCELTAGTIIGGSTVIGNSTWTGLNSTLKDNIRVGNNVIIGAGAMVIKNVDDEDIVAGVPAKSIKSKVNTKLSFLMAGQKD